MQGRHATIRAAVDEKWIERFDVSFTIRERGLPEVIPTGLGGMVIPRGTLTEVHGPASSGKTSLLHAVLARGTSAFAGRPECCALIDAGGNFDPISAAEAGVDLKRVLWVRCGGSAENALKAVDLVIQAGGFGVVALDLAGVSVREARRIPLASWFRLRHAVAKTRTALVVSSEEVNAHSCSTLQVRTAASRYVMRGNLLCGVESRAECGARAQAPLSGRAQFRLEPLYRA